MHRSRRRFFESIFFSAAYRCEECRFRVRVPRLTGWKNKRYVSCPRCGGFTLSVLSRRDYVDAISKNPLRFILGKLKARLYHCRACRLQFHDVRRRAPSSDRKRKADFTNRNAIASR